MSCLAALVLAVWHLGLARIRFARRSAGDTIAQLCARSPEPPAPAGLQRRLSWAIAAAAPRLPWRTDCLIRCLAAAGWLAATGHGHRLHLGIRRPAAHGLQAHAWLVTGEHVVAGDIADIASFTPLDWPAGQALATHIAESCPQATES